MRMRWMGVMLGLICGASHAQMGLGISIEDAEMRGIEVVADEAAPSIGAARPKMRTVSTTILHDDASGEVREAQSVQAGDQPHQPQERAQPVAAPTPAPEQGDASGGNPLSVIEQKLLEALQAQQRGRANATSASGDAAQPISPSEHGKPVAEKNVIAVTPGVTEIIQIPTSYLTRIITPFAKPNAKSLNDVEVEVVGPTIFVAPNMDLPIGLFIFDSEDPSMAITLQLVPRDIPQRDITLRLSGPGGSPMGRAQEATKPAQAHPHTTTIMTTLKDIARGRLPSGYAVSVARGDEAVCDIPGTKTMLGQIVEGASYRIAVFLVKNVADQPIEVDEQLCHRSGVVGVAAWPDTVLEPGGKTELYVMMWQADSRGQDASERPSLLQNAL